MLKLVISDFSDNWNSALPAPTTRTPNELIGTIDIRLLQHRRLSAITAKVIGIITENDTTSG